MVLLGRLGLGIGLGIGLGLVFRVKVRVRHKFSVRLSFNNNLFLSHVIHSHTYV